jgi:hypothetical protein
LGCTSAQGGTSADDPAAEQQKPAAKPFTGNAISSKRMKNIFTMQ